MGYAIPVAIIMQLSYPSIQITDLTWKLGAFFYTKAHDL